MTFAGPLIEQAHIISLSFPIQQETRSAGSPPNAHRAGHESATEQAHWPVQQMAHHPLSENSQAASSPATQPAPRMIHGQAPSMISWPSLGGMPLRQAKMGAVVWVPVLPELRAMLDDSAKTSTQIVVSELRGRPYKELGFQHTLATICAEEGLPADLQYRDLRRTLVTALEAAGCTDDQIRAVSGHKTRAGVAAFVRSDKTFATGAMDRLEKARRNAS